MRKGIFVVFLLVAIVAIVTVPAGAKDEKVTTSQGQPFQEIWNAIKDLQNKLDKIQLIPGPVGPQGIQGPKGDTGSCSCEVSLKEFNLLKERVAALEGGCHPVPETCNGIDDNCDGLIDNGAICGTGQECVGGQCTSGCQPAPEVCNNKDDDCDGIVDENLGSLTCGLGECYRIIDLCVNGNQQVCIPGTPKLEVCNGKDDNCNFFIDDRAQCAYGQQCIDGMCISVCQPVSEVCNGKDDDCDGLIDNGNLCGIGEQCISGLCMGGCQPVSEVCNSKDDDCDGIVDEDLGTKTCGIGECARTVETCVGGVMNKCIPGTPAVDVCNGKDDDCDGVIDDLAPCPVGQQCISGLCRVG